MPSLTPIRMTQRVLVTGSLLAVSYSAIAACSSEDSNPFGDGAGGTNTGGNSSGGGSATGGAGPSSGGINGSGGNIIGDSGVGGGGSDADACADSTQTAERKQIDMHFVMDQSGSMWGTTQGGLTKWSAVKEAMIAFFSDTQSEGMGAGIQYFPLPSEGLPSVCQADADCGVGRGCNFRCAANPNNTCMTDAECDPVSENGPCLGQCSGNNVFTCDIPTYAAPAVNIAPLPGNRQPLIDSVNGQLPNGSTPTHAALSGGIQYAQDWATQNPDRRSIVVLVTDGQPTSCPPTDIQQIAQVAADGLPDVTTFAIGVFTPDGATQGRNNLDTIAQAGGSDEAFIVDTMQDVRQEFLDALEEIRGEGLTCELALPEPPPGRSLDFRKVSVVITEGQNATTVDYVGAGVAGCDPVAGGWYYDEDPTVDGGPEPTKITLCPTTCESVKELQEAELAIKLGCENVIQ